MVQALHQQPHPPRCRPLGNLNIRGMKQPHMVFQMEWTDEASSDFLTISGRTNTLSDMPTL